MYRVIRRAMLQEDEGHDQEYGEFETRETAQSWIDNIGTTDGYFSASSFYIQDTFNFVDAHLDEIRRKYIAAPLADAFKAGLEAGFRAGAEAMREAAAKHIEGGRATLEGIHYTEEFILKAKPALVIKIVQADAEAATRHRIVQVIRALPLPRPGEPAEPPK